MKGENGLVPFPFFVFFVFSSIFGITLGPGWIFCTKCDFLQVLDLHIFRQKRPGHWAEVFCHFHLPFKSFILSTSQYCVTRAFVAPSMSQDSITRAFAMPSTSQDSVTRAFAEPSSSQYCITCVFVVPSSSQDSVTRAFAIRFCFLSRIATDCS